LSVCSASIFIDTALTSTKDFLKLLTYSAFFAAIVHFYGLPLHIIRDLYMTFRSFVQKCRDLIRYRQATANMNEKYPNATQEELDASDKICIICREEMSFVQVVRGTINPLAPKKLNCGHIFHFRCLRSWLERQQACPTWCVLSLDNEYFLIQPSRRSVLDPTGFKILLHFSRLTLLSSSIDSKFG
jgi:hypothetical protein